MTGATGPLLAGMLALIGLLLVAVCAAPEPRGPAGGVPDDGLATRAPAGVSTPRTPATGSGPRGVRAGARDRVSPGASSGPPIGAGGLGTAPLDLGHLVERLASVISAGVPTRAAWSAVAEASPPGPLRDLARAVGAGADARDAASPALARRGEVRAIGAAMELCQITGAPTAALLRSLAGGLRDVADADLARRSAFAGPRATARILLVLPAAGIGLGMLLGANPLAVLVGTSVGRGLLVLGLVLTTAGWCWMRRLLRSAAGPPRAAVDSSIVLDLVAGPLLAGAPLSTALAAVAASLGDEPSAIPLQRAARALQTGAQAELALAGLPADLDALRDAVRIAHATGADIAPLLRGAAADARRGRARDAEAAAARLSVRLVLPTGLALLPAFVVLGIVPTTMSLLGGSLAQVATP